MLENEKSKVEDLTDHLKDYLNARADLAVMKIIDKSSDIFSGFISGLILGLVVFFFLLFSSLALAWWIGAIFENIFLGFLLVAFFYFLLALLIYFKKEKWIKTPITNIIIKKTLNTTHEED